jgi:hypothetical protein
MKTAKATCATLFLALSFSVPVYAEDNNPGEVHTPGRPQIVCTGETPNRTAEPCMPTTNAGNGSFPDFVDIFWAVASIF